MDPCQKKKDYKMYDQNLTDSVKYIFNLVHCENKCRLQNKQSFRLRN